MRYLGNNQTSMGVPGYSSMLPMGMGHSHQRRRLQMAVATAGHLFQNVQFRTKISLCLVEAALQPGGNVQIKPNSSYSTNAPRLLVPKGALGSSNSTICSRKVPNRCPKTPKLARIGC